MELSDIDLSSVLQSKNDFKKRGAYNNEKNVPNLQKGKKVIKLQIEKRSVLKRTIAVPSISLMHITFHQDFQTVFYCFLISVTKHIL